MAMIQPHEKSKVVTPCESLCARNTTCMPYKREANVLFIPLITVRQETEGFDVSCKQHTDQFLSQTL